MAPGNRKGSGKATFGKLEIALFNNMYFADQVSTGVKIIQAREIHTLGATPPVTVTVTNAANYSKDLGVFYGSGPLAGQQFIFDNATPTVAGHYNLNTSTGVYTFSAADENAVVFISYVYSNTAGNTVTINQQLMGYGPIVELWLSQPYQGTNGMHLESVRFGKFTAPLKRDDFQIAELDFQFFANPAGVVMEMFQTTP